MILFRRSAARCRFWSRFDDNILLQKIKGLAQQDLFRQAVHSVVFFEFLAHFFHGNIVMRRLFTNAVIDLFPRHLDLLVLGDSMENKVRLQTMRRERPGAFDQLLFFAFEQVIGHAPFPIPVHQLVQRATCFALQKAGRQIKADVLVQKFHDLRFLGPLDFVLLFVLEIMLNRVAQIGQSLVRQQLGRERIIQRPARTFSLISFSVTA